MNLCNTCIYAVWDEIEYHSAKECGMCGGNARVLFDCKKADVMTDEVAAEWEKTDPEVKDCPNFEEYIDERY